MKLLATRQANYLPENANLFSSWLQETYEKGGNATPIAATFESYATRGHGGNGVVFGLMLTRAQLFSEAVFTYRNASDGKLFGTTDLLPLEKPWANGSTGELLIRMIQDADLAGNAFIRKDLDGSLARLRPDWVNAVLMPVGEADERTRYDVAGYTYWVDGPGSRLEFYPVEEVAHWSPIPDPLSHWRGMSWLTPVVREINADLAMTDYKRRFMDNNATPNLLIRYQQKLTPSALERVRDVWNSRYGGTDGLKTAFLDSGADATIIGNSLQAIDFTGVQAAGENRIAVAAGVPGIVAGLKEGLSAATYSNYQQAMRRFADITMRPLWRSVCACLAALVPERSGADLWYDVSGIAALREGEQEQAVTLKTKAITAQALILSGYVPDSVTAAITANDMSLLKHSGAIPTALYPEGQVPPDDVNEAKEVGKWKS